MHETHLERVLDASLLCDTRRAVLLRLVFIGRTVPMNTHPYHTIYRISPARRERAQCGLPARPTFPQSQTSIFTSTLMTTQPASALQKFRRLVAMFLPSLPLRRLAGVLALSSLCVLPSALLAQIGSDPWISSGGPAFGNRNFTLPPNSDVSGCVAAVAAHPTNPNILYVAGVGGGVWRTVNATAASPTWTPLTDNLASLSMGSLEFDVTDAASQTLVAGSARVSSFASIGGLRIGVLRTTDGGTTWTVLNPGNMFANENIQNVAARGAVILAASHNSPDNVDVDRGGQGGGLFRSTDTGATFTLISDGTPNRLPSGSVTDLIADPQVPTRFYAAVRTVGIFRSDDTGATWTNITGTIAGFDGTTLRPRIGAFNNGANQALYVGIIVANGTLGSVWRSADPTAANPTWVQMDAPAIYPPVSGEDSAQGAIHFSIVADPTNANLVYFGGSSISTSPFSAALVRGDASLPRGSQFTAITDGNTGNNGTIHGDSRKMVFDAAGNLIECDDGGVYRRSTPATNAGIWTSVNGNLNCIEAHDVAYDSVAKVAMLGLQDNGTTIQTATGSQNWTSLSGGDGGDVAIDDTSTNGQSVRYYSSQNLGGFSRATYGTNNALIGAVAYPALTVQGGGPAFLPHFVTPVVVNKVNATRLIIGGTSRANPLPVVTGAAYESLDRGDTITALTPNSPVNGTFSGGPIAYGGFRAGVPNADLLYYGSGNTIKVRTVAGAALADTPKPPFTSGTVISLVLDSNNWQRVFATDGRNIVVTNDTGANWTDITGNLNGFGAIRKLEFFPLNGNDCIAAATDRGVFFALTTNLTEWNRLGTGLPNAVVYDMVYNATDKVLVIGTLGRGAFLYNVPSLAAPLAPMVALSLANFDQNAPTILIAGTNFSTTPANNTVAFDLGATGTVTAATPTRLTVTFNTPPTTLGTLTAVVTVTGLGNSGNPVQVANVVANTMPTVTLDTTRRAEADPTITIEGTNFSTTPGNNTVSFNLGATGTVIASTPTQLTVSFSTRPAALGTLNAAVSVAGVGDSGAPVEVEDVVGTDIDGYLKGGKNADLLFQNNAGQLYAWYLNGIVGVSSQNYIYPGGLGDWKLVSRADVDGDGNADLIFQNNLGQIYAWFLDGSGGTVNFSTGAGLLPGKPPGYLFGGGLGDWRLATCTDLNGDGIPDLIFQNAAGQIYVWFLDGTGDPVNFTTGTGLKRGLSPQYLYAGGLGDWRLIASADMNGDGNADLIFQNTAGQIYVWFLDGTGNALNFFNGVGLKAGMNAKFLYSGGTGDLRLKAVGDFDGDGIQDFVFQNTAGQIYAWFLDGTANTVNFTTRAGLKGSQYLYSGSTGDWKVR